MVGFLDQMPIYPTNYTPTTTYPTNYSTDDPDGDVHIWESGDTALWEESSTEVFE